MSIKDLMGELEIVRGLDEGSRLHAVSKLVIMLRRDHSLGTAKTYLSHARRLYKQSYGESDGVFAALRLDTAEYTALKGAFNGAVSRRHGQLSATPPYVAMISKAHALLRGRISSMRDYADVALGVCIVTGRRPVEAALKGAFRLQRNKKNTLIFSGQAKTKGIVSPPYDIPCLSSVSVTVAAVRRMRDSDPYKELAEVHAQGGFLAFSNKFGHYFTQALGRSGLLPFRAHDIRAAYAELCFELFSPSCVSKDYYFSAILGHHSSSDGESRDIVTAQSYIRYRTPSASILYKVRSLLVLGKRVRENPSSVI